MSKKEQTKNQKKDAENLLSNISDVKSCLENAIKNSFVALIDDDIFRMYKDKDLHLPFVTKKYENLPYKVFNYYGVFLENSVAFENKLNNIISSVSTRGHDFCPYSKDLGFYFSLIIFLHKINGKDIVEDYIVDFFEDFSIYQFDYIGFLLGKLQQFIIKFTWKKLKNDKTREFLVFGASRRISMLVEQLQGIFSVYERERRQQITKEDASKLALHLTFLYPNILALFDCLAFALQFEKNIIENFNYDDDNDKRKVDLFDKENKFINSLSQESQKRMINLAKWNKDIKTLRHSCSHRIPFYIPGRLTEIEFDTQQRMINDLGQEFITFSNQFREKWRADTHKHGDLLKQN